MWTFRTYVSPTGRSDVQADIDRLSASCSEHFRRRLDYLAITEKLDWKRPEAAKLVGLNEIYEIRFKADGVQVRPLGCFGPQDRTFTILVWAIKKQSDYRPREALSTSSRRRKELFRGEARSAPLQIDGEDFSPSE